MATLAPIATPARQPFGILSDSKVRSLQNLKNRQNAITPSSAPSLKRRAASPEMGSDSENIDPNILDSLNKRKRSAFDDDVSASKANRYSLTVTPTVTSTSTKRRLETRTPRLDTTYISKSSSTTPSSAPATAAGRSPTRHRSSLLKPNGRRLNLPSFPRGGSTPSPALSLSAALNGTKKSSSSSRTTTNNNHHLLHSRRSSRSGQTRTSLRSSKPQSWFFDIYEETEETQDYRMNEWTMTQSATGLDISDDESRASSKKSEKLDKGKENVDPNQVMSSSAPVTRSMAAAEAVAAAAAEEKDLMTTDVDEEARTPLADLNPAKFYGDGLDATSVVLVQDDDEAEAETDIEEDDHEEYVKPPVGGSGDFTFQNSTTMTAEVLEELVGTPSLNGILSAASPSYGVGIIGATAAAAKASRGVGEAGLVDLEIENGHDSIEIWESESAKDENEKVDVDVDVDHNVNCPGTPGSIGVGDENVFALQEL
ncbi:uncharacterized protein PV06_08987 [Exophiala oligosperma]|uniref:Uncharacterized protein n=1 Tax=Exophiala oligosperma TaxID=215243 RepID=A0A0D2BNV2_9EURO|nr:uncharacterized protein PV06_08987 [Exophiala oligosperma]KIW39192.1 hypothetical protein PV06_08987 [Exophiala oligosperma]